MNGGRMRIEFSANLRAVARGVVAAMDLLDGVHLSDEPRQTSLCFSVAVSDSLISSIYHCKRKMPASVAAAYTRQYPPLPPLLTTIDSVDSITTDFAQFHTSCAQSRRTVTYATVESPRSR